LYENYKMEMISKYGPDRENHLSFDGAAWCVASGGQRVGYMVHLVCQNQKLIQALHHIPTQWSHHIQFIVSSIAKGDKG